MAQFQYQEQEDLMADFDAPIEESRKYTSRDIRSRKSFDNEINRREKEVPKSTWKPSISEHSQAREAGHKLNYIKAETNDPPEGNKEENVYDGVADFEDGIDILSTTVMEFAGIAFEIMKDVALEAPKHEEEFRFITALSLIFYGGSWTNFAGTIAAFEAFGTKQVLEEAYEVGKSFFFDDFSDDEVTPRQIKDNFRKLGLQIALLIAVLVSPSWAEICITVAFASKYTSLVNVEELLKNSMSSPDEVDTEFDEYFNSIDTSWFDLIAVVACNIVSLIAFGCFPRLTTAMYMGYLGVSLFMEGLGNRQINIPLVWESEIFDKDYWMKKSTQYYTWGIVAVMAVWQAYTDYNGVCLLLSWSMFLFPLVKVYKFFGTNQGYEDVKTD